MSLILQEELNEPTRAGETRQGTGSGEEKAIGTVPADASTTVESTGNTTDGQVLGTRVPLPMLPNPTFGPSGAKGEVELRETGMIKNEVVDPLEGVDVIVEQNKDSSTATGKAAGTAKGESDGQDEEPQEGPPFLMPVPQGKATDGKAGATKNPNGSRETDKGGKVKTKNNNGGKALGQVLRTNPKRKVTNGKGAAGTARATKKTRGSGEVGKGAQAGTGGKASGQPLPTKTKGQVTYTATGGKAGATKGRGEREKGKTSGTSSYTMSGKAGAAKHPKVRGEDGPKGKTENVRGGKGTQKVNGEGKGKGKGKEKH
jgi:hypothetical protein